MGLFDRFGAGGGKLELQPNSAHLAPGDLLEGRVAFVGGTRSQQITNITLKLGQTLYFSEQTPQGPQQRTRSSDVVPERQLTGPFASTPGERHEFPFSIQLPPQLTSSQPQVCSYRLSCSADIDNEIDPGTGVDLTIVGAMPAQAIGMPGQQAMGMPGQAVMGQPMMGMPGQAVMGQPMMGMPGQPMMGQPMMGQPMMPAPIGVGSRVFAQWQDGQLHPGSIVRAENGYFAVDWDNPALGVTTWVAPHQVQAAAMSAQPMIGQPMMGQPMIGMPGQPNVGQPIGYPVQHAMPVKEAKDAKSAHQVHSPVASKTGLAHGTAVTAQGPGGGFHFGRIADHQNGHYAVDWDDPSLGVTSWVPEHQVKAR